MKADKPPVLATERLRLRPFDLADASRVEALAGAYEVADTTLTLPHPYPPGAAAVWIGTHGRSWETGSAVIYAIEEASNDTVIGCISLGIAAAHSRAEIGYWIGVPYWNKGYCTEAGRALLDLGFATLGLHRIDSRHFTRNPASGRVMQKLGMQLEGIQREAIRKGDRFEDVALYSILDREWAEQAPPS